MQENIRRKRREGKKLGPCFCELTGQCKVRALVLNSCGYLADNIVCV